MLFINRTVQQCVIKLKCEWEGDRDEADVMAVRNVHGADIKMQSLTVASLAVITLKRWVVLCNDTHCTLVSC